MRKLIRGMIVSALVLPSIAAMAAPARSSIYGTTITSTNQQIVDGQYNEWLLSGGKAYRNSQLTPSNSVILLVYYDGIVYQENSAHKWWAWLDGVWVAGTDPRQTSAGSTTIPHETHLVDSSHCVWTLVGGQVYANGYLRPSSGVIQLLYAKGIIYQENSAHKWWLWGDSGWEVTSAPLVASSNGSTISLAGQLVDNQLKSWTLSGGVAYVGGAATPSGSVIQLLYYNGSVYQENNAHNWWQWKNGGWAVVAADPRVPALAAAAGFKTLTFDSTVLGTTSGTWQTSNLNDIPGCSGAAVQNDDGSFTVSGRTANRECYVVSAVKSTTGVNGWAGVTFQPGMYLKVVLSYVGTNAGFRNGGLPGGVPGFWATAIEHADGARKSNGALLDQWPGQAPDYEHWMQVDLMAAFCSSGDSPGAPACQGDANGDNDLLFTNLDDFYGNTNSGLVEDGSTGGALLQNGQSWATPHTLEYVWVAASGSTTGHIDAYVDGIEYENGGDTWTAYNPASPPNNYSNLFSIGDAQHMVFATGTGVNADLTVHSVQVWQSSLTRRVKQ